jgi:hypothetical protein
MRLDLLPLFVVEPKQIASHCQVGVVIATLALAGGDYFTTSVDERTESGRPILSVEQLRAGQTSVGIRF